ncbi:hypothetical protein SEA_GUUELAD_134 [Mycobacterium phage GuuelaD]|uniref:Uncharacterized protein n=1 Tax=Mycobacterium phage GuuelaD TaxID=2015819 RepID=A0A286MQN2_9CAUD|nr:hypothetical protein J4T97_gp107 [Mycobacterium phage GuuelaD]ASW31557.1 hypothetical protein SEA_GUUELAD_134 [Mycobacterium phage GuuelaD]
MPSSGVVRYPVPLAWPLALPWHGYRPVALAALWLALPGPLRRALCWSLAAGAKQPKRA